jgi:hypothetical protein
MSRQTAHFVHDELTTEINGGQMMQADTVGTPKAAPLTGATAPKLSKAAPSMAPLALNADITASFWRAVPILFGLAAWLPQIWSSLISFSKGSLTPAFAPAAGGFIETTLLKLVGPDGIAVFGAGIAALTAYGVWALARAVASPRWAAATMASVAVVAPVFGLAPSPIVSPDDAAFGAMMTLALAAVVWAGRREDSNCLMIAFLLAIVAAALRPGAAWPAFAVGIAALLATKKLEEGPLLGMFSSLCWAPGLYFANKIFGSEDGLENLAQSQSVIEATRNIAAANIAAADKAVVSWPDILQTLLSAVPFVVFGLAAIAGCVVLFLLGKSRRRGAIVGATGALVSIVGAAFYGDLDAARLLLDPIFLGIGAATGLVLPALIKQIKTASAQKSG